MTMAGRGRPRPLGRSRGKSTDRAPTVARSSAKPIASKPPIAAACRRPGGLYALAGGRRAARRERQRAGEECAARRERQLVANVDRLERRVAIVDRLEGLSHRPRRRHSLRGKPPRSQLAAFPLWPGRRRAARRERHVRSPAPSPPRVEPAGMPRGSLDDRRWRPFRAGGGGRRAARREGPREGKGGRRRGRRAEGCESDQR